MKAGTASLKSAQSIVRDRLRHQCADQNQGRSGGVARNRGRQRRTEHGEHEQRGNEYVAEPGASAGGDAGHAFDVAGDGGGARPAIRRWFRSRRPTGRVRRAGILPSLMKPPCSQTPTRVPTLSKRSTNRKANRISRNPRWMAPRKSSCRKVDDGCGMETIAEGQLEMPRSIPQQRRADNADQDCRR